MDLHVVWFVLIAVLFAGFFFLEGFDYGVGMLLPFLGRNDGERRAIINTIGPVWDANEVWMITAGGAMFAAFPHWYATLFSGFYLALFLMLMALILRGVAFEYRSKRESPTWRNFWDWSIFVGSALPALLWGVAVANLVRGVPINADMQYAGHFADLLSPYALLGGLTAVSIFVLHGANFLVLKLDGELAERAHRVAYFWGALATGGLVLFALGLYRYTALFAGRVVPGIVPLVSAAALVSVRFLLQARQDAWAFWMGGLSIVAAVASAFMGLFPNVMPSSLNPAWSLTIYNASASDYTLGIMTVVALIFTPLVLLYQGWSYWVFRGRMRIEKESGY